MEFQDLLIQLEKEKRIVSIVGGGGKTTLMYTIAEALARKGRKVLVSTTTHILKPDTNYAADAEEAESLWKSGTYAVIGSPALTKAGSKDHAEAKLSFPNESLYTRLAAEADLILLEADGAKHHPVKLPAAHEPVIRKESDLVLAVMGMTALYRPMKDVCFRFEEAGAWLSTSPDGLFTPALAARILSDERGARKHVGAREYIVVLNQCDTPEICEDAKQIAELLEKQEIPVIRTKLK